MNAETFEIAIQSGAMLAVIWEYRSKLFGAVAHLPSDPSARRFVANVLIAFLPAVAAGLLLGDVIQEYLFHPVPVAVAFIVGGLVILLVEKRRGSHQEHHDEDTDAGARVRSVDAMNWIDALKVGLAQCLALIPGTSRSGATIIGGMIFGLSRRTATEFSFFLAIPTLMSAGAYSLLKQRDTLTAADLPVFATGTVVSFVFALLCIRWLIRYVSRHDFTVFAWYRIAFGLVILLTAYTGLVVWH